MRGEGGGEGGGERGEGGGRAYWKQAIELIVATLEQVNMGIEQVRVSGDVGSSVLVT